MSIPPTVELLTGGLPCFGGGVRVKTIISARYDGEGRSTNVWRSALGCTDRRYRGFPPLDFLGSFSRITLPARHGRIAGDFGLLRVALGKNVCVMVSRDLNSAPSLSESRIHPSQERAITLAD